MKVSGKVIKGNKFAFNGCHKIYIIESEEDENEALSMGYEILCVGKLKETFENSCGLRFIRNWKLDKLYVPQFQKTVTFD